MRQANQQTGGEKEEGTEGNVYMEPLKKQLVTFLRCAKETRLLKTLKHTAV